MNVPTLTTERLVLRPAGMGDLDLLHALWTDPDVRRYLWDDVVITRDRAAETLRGAVAGEREGYGLWVATDREGRLAGFCALLRQERGDPELLYGLAPSHWGKGLATEASRAVLAYAFETLGVARVSAATDAPNAASVRVMERLGMRFTRRGPLNGLDTLFYELRREDVTERRARR